MPPAILEGGVADVKRVEGQGIPLQTALVGNSLMGVFCLQPCLSMNPQVDRISRRAVEVDVQSPNDVVHMANERPV